jgi:lipopolysaccharide transport system permease protein
MMVWMYITPIMYPISIVPDNYRILFYINPLTSLVDTYRWVFLDTGSLPLPQYFLVSFAVAMVIWFVGALAFRSMENRVADVM